MALLVALTVNRRVIVRPNVFLCLVSLLVIEAIVTSLQPQHFGTVYRTFRLAEFVAALWLLTPWWGRRDLLLVRCHLASLVGRARLGAARPAGGARPSPRRGQALRRALGYTAHAGRALRGGYARAGGRALALRHDAWPATPAHCRRDGTILILTHTRTALVGMVAGLLVAGLSLIVAKARVRKFFAAASVMASIAIITLSGVITTWLARGQGTQQLTDLTGRTKVWGPLLAFPRDKFQEIFGFGLSNGSFNGLPIDSNWLASYQNRDSSGWSSAR